MKNKTFIFLLTAVVVAVIPGCTMFGSPDAAILGFASDAIVGEPVIDAAEKTVTVTVKPMDLAAFEPVINVSEKATVSLPDKIEDGVPAVYRITAENTEVSEWKVTFNVAYGVSFGIDGQSWVMMQGITHSGDPSVAAEYGNGVPGICRITDEAGNYCISYVWKQLYDIDKGMEQDKEDGGVLAFDEGQSTGQEFTFIKYSEETRSHEELDYLVDLDIGKFGKLGEDFVAAFKGKAKIGTSSIDGFAKLRVVEKAELPW